MNYQDGEGGQPIMVMLDSSSGGRGGDTEFVVGVMEKKVVKWVLAVTIWL